MKYICHLKECVHSFHLFFLSHCRLFKNNSEVYLTVIVKILIWL